MSITYSFHIGTDRTALDVGRVVGARADGALPDAYGPGRPAYVLIKATAPDPVEDGLYAAAHGFRPRVAVTVELAKDADDERPREQPAITVLSRLVDGLDDDLYVSYLGDHPVLVRRRGSIVVDARWAAERPWFGAVFRTPHHVGVVADPYAGPGA